MTSAASPFALGHGAAAGIKSFYLKRLAFTASTLAVANPGADHAVLAAVLEAELQRRILRLAELWCVGKAVRAAGLVAVDRERDAALLGGHHLLACAGAF